MLFIHGSGAAMVMGHRLGFAAAVAGATAVTTHHSCKQHSSDLAHNIRGHAIHTNKYKVLQVWGALAQHIAQKRETAPSMQSKQASSGTRPAQRRLGMHVKLSLLVPKLYPSLHALGGSLQG
jgi:hypothetical protein